MNRKPVLTDRILRGIVSLQRPSISDQVWGAEDAEGELTEAEQVEVANAKLAVEWAERMLLYRAQRKG